MPSVTHMQARRARGQTHVLSLYDSEEQRQSRLADWVAEGLDRDEKVIYPLAPAGDMTQSLWWALEAHGIDPGPVHADGRVEQLLLPRFYDPAALPGLVSQALAEGHSGVRMSHEPRWALSLLSRRALLQHEQAVDRTARDRPLSFLCQYPMDGLRRDRLRATIAAHAAGTRGPRVHLTSNGRAFTVAGTVDEADAELLAMALRTYTETSEPTIHIDLTRADGVGAEGWRAVAEGTQDFRGRGGQVELTTASHADGHHDHGVDNLINLHMA